MLIIIDKKIPEEAKTNLRKYGELLELETSGITYAAISGHPDIFFTMIDDFLLVAPGLPREIYDKLENAGVNFNIGQGRVGDKYPGSARYNAVVGNDYLIHNTKITDKVILDASKNKKQIHVGQGYTRCNLIFIDRSHAVTSDMGIYRVLKEQPVDLLYVDPDGIILPGFDHGFFGGCCGVFGNQLFVLGNPEKHSFGEPLRNYIEAIGMDIIPLCDSQVFDGGGIFFVGA